MVSSRVFLGAFAFLLLLGVWASAASASDTLSLTVRTSEVVHLDDRGSQWYAQGTFLDVQSTRLDAFQVNDVRTGRVLVSTGEQGVGTVYLPNQETVYYYDDARQYWIPGFSNTVTYNCLANELCQDTLSFTADKSTNPPRALAISGQPDGYVFSSRFMQVQSSRRAFSFSDASVNQLLVSLENGESTQSGTAPQKGDYFYYTNPTTTGGVPSRPVYKKGGSLTVLYYQDAPLAGVTNDKQSCTYLDVTVNHHYCQSSSFDYKQVLWCENGNFTRNCGTCGCPSSSACATDGACYSLFDGTRLNTYPDIQDGPVPSAFVSAIPSVTPTLFATPEPTTVVLTPTPQPSSRPAGAECLADADCSDNNPCTVDRCAFGNDKAFCTHSPPTGCAWNGACVPNGVNAQVNGREQTCVSGRFQTQSSVATPTGIPVQASGDFFANLWGGVNAWFAALGRIFFGS